MNFVHQIHHQHPNLVAAERLRRSTVSEDAIPRIMV